MRFYKSHTSTSFLLWETLIQLTSLVNPLRYCCRDGRLRNAVLELLRIRKPPVGHPRTVCAVRYVRRKELSRCMYSGRYLGVAQRVQTFPLVENRILWSSSGFRSWSRNMSWNNVYTIPARSHACWYGNNLSDFSLQKPSPFILLEAVKIHGGSDQGIYNKKKSSTEGSKNLIFDYCFLNFFPPTEFFKNWYIYASE